MKTRLALTAGLMAMLLAGCGNTTEDRALSGGALGAGTGAIIGGLAGAPFLGALVGGGAGAATGAATSSSDVNLGTPIWKR